MNWEELKKLWPEYERIRKGGLYNMFTQGSYVAERMGIDLDTYFQLLWNYDKLRDEINANKG